MFKPIFFQLHLEENKDSLAAYLFQPLSLHLIEQWDTFCLPTLDKNSVLG